MALKSPVAANIQRLRNSKGLFQVDVAKRAGISRVAFRAIETGQTRDPRVSNLQGIAKALGVGLQDLLAEPPRLCSVRFRSRKPRSQKDQARREQIAVDVARWLDDFNDLEALLGSKRPHALADIRRRSASMRTKKDPVRAAGMARNALGLGPGDPIRDIAGLLESAGVKVRSLPSDLDGFFGMSVAEGDGGPAIVVNASEDISVERQIFTAAHELGHLVLHPEAYNIAKVQEDAKEEQEADVFASHFLMPEEGFRKQWQEASGRRLVDRVLHVKRILRVSYKTVLYRLIEMGIADKRIWARFSYEYKRQYRKSLGWREEPKPVGRGDVEPLGLEKADFMEDRLSSLVRRAVEQGETSVSRAAEILGVDLQAMRDRITSWEFAA